MLGTVEAQHVLVAVLVPPRPRTVLVSFTRRQVVARQEVLALLPLLVLEVNARPMPHFDTSLDPTRFGKKRRYRRNDESDTLRRRHGYPPFVKEPSDNLRPLTIAMPIVNGPKYDFILHHFFKCFYSPKNLFRYLRNDCIAKSL